MNNPGKLLSTISKMQKTMSAIQKDVESAMFDGEVSGGLVKVRVSGKGELVSIKLDSALKDEDNETVEDLIQVAFRDAYNKKEAYAKEKLKSIGGGLGSIGLGMPGLGG